MSEPIKTEFDDDVHGHIQTVHGVREIVDGIRKRYAETGTIREHDFEFLVRKVMRAVSNAEMMLN